MMHVFHGKSDILTTPFELNNIIQVGETHQTPKYDKRFTVFYNGNTDTHYYSENIEQNIADIEMGHTIQITDDEKKLFYNIICHLFVKRNKNVASLKLDK